MIFGSFLSCIVVLQLAIVYVLHAGQQQAQQRVHNAMHRPQFILFGDSITQHSFDEGGWGARLASHYQRKADIVLRGYSGYNIAWAQHLVQKVFPQDAAIKPALVTVFFGANDAALADGVNRRQHVPLQKYRELLRDTVRHLASCGAAARVIITPPPVDERARISDRKMKWGVNEYSEQPDRLNAVTGAYAAACRAVGTEEGVPVLDIWTEFQKNPEWRTYLSDGLHLTPSGNAALFELLMALIEKQLLQLRFDTLKFDFPLHDDIAAEDPAVAFTNH